MPDRVVFNIVIPRTDAFTALIHPPEKFPAWLVRTVELFGGASVVGLNLQGLWYDEDRPTEENPIEDFSNWYKVGVKPEKIDELRRFVEEATQEFGQKCIYLERAGDADFIGNPTLPPPGPARLTNVNRRSSLGTST